MLPTPAAAASRTAAVAHAGTDATHRGSNRRKSTRLRSRPQQRSCSSVGSVGAGGPAGTDRDAADACRSGVMHRGSRTCRYRCNSPCQQPAQEHSGCAAGRNNAAAAQWAVWAPAAQQGPTVMLPTPAAAASCTAAVAHDGTDATLRASNRRKSTPAAQPVATTQLQLSGQCGRLGPSRTDRDAADACRSGITHRGSRTCRYRCNSPWQQPAQEHPAAQPAATTQLQLSGQCGRRRPSRDRP